MFKYLIILIIITAAIIGCNHSQAGLIDNPDNSRADLFDLMWADALNDSAGAALLATIDTQRCIYEQFEDIMLDEMGTQQALDAWRYDWSLSFPDMAAEPDLDVRFFAQLWYMIYLKVFCPNQFKWMA